MNKMAELPGLSGCDERSADRSSPQVMVDIDRDKASALGRDAGASRERALQRLRAAADLDDLYADVNEYWVVMEVDAAIPARSG